MRLPHLVQPGPPAGRRAAGWRLACGLALLAGLASACAGAEPVGEYQVKAAFLYNFTKFVEWPARHFAADNSPIVIGVLKPNPFGEELEKIIRGRKAGSRSFVVRYLDTPTGTPAPDVLFVPAGQEGRLDRGALAELQAAGVLTVGESPPFGDLGGLITFEIETDKVRFQVNQGAAERAGFRLSAQFLKLATTVRKGF